MYKKQLEVLHVNDQPLFIACTEERLEVLHVNGQPLLYCTYRRETGDAARYTTLYHIRSFWYI